MSNREKKRGYKPMSDTVQKWERERLRELAEKTAGICRI